MTVARVGAPPTRFATGCGGRSGNGDMVPLSSGDHSEGTFRSVQAARLCALLLVSLGRGEWDG